MDSAVEKLRQKGVDIKGSDFKTIVTGTFKTAVSMAFDADTLKNLFTPLIWQGQLAEMQDAWYNLESWSSKKDKFDFVKVQTLVAAGEGKPFREGQLKEWGSDIGEVRSAVSSGNYEGLRKKLAAHGDHFRREDVLLLDKYGDHTLDVSAAWTHFGQLWDELARNGERLEVADFLFHSGKRDSILKDAEDAGDGLKELFNPRLWHGRTTDVISLYNLLAPGARAKVQIDAVLDDLAD